MRWVILTHDAPPQRGGIATWTRWAAEALGRDHQVQMFARHRPGLAPGVRGVRGFSQGRWGPLTTTAVAARTLRSADAVLATTWAYARFVHRVAPGVPVHTVAHGTAVTGPTNPLLTRAWNRCAGRWAVSSYLACRLGDHGVEAQVLPVPIPAVARATGGQNWLMVARATPFKGGERFLRIAAAAGARAVLVGAGAELPRWRALAADLNAGAKILGSCSRAEVAHELDRARLLALLPRFDGHGGEGLGLVLLEARARGIPVVGCRTGGVPEAVGDGLLLDDPDDPDRSAAQIDQELVPADPQLLRREHSPERFLEVLCG